MNPPAKEFSISRDEKYHFTEHVRDDIKNNHINNEVNTVIIGSIALDTISRLSKPKPVMNDSNPGSTRSSIGGVGYNVSLACKYGLSSPYFSSKEGGISRCRLISIVANDFAGKSLLKQLEATNIDTSGILITEKEKKSTAQYVSIHDDKGELLLASADMTLIEQDFSEHIVEQLERAKPHNIVIDCNITPHVMSKILRYVSNNSKNAKVILEPTSAFKAERLSQVDSASLDVFPRNSILLVTPTVTELHTLYNSFAQRNLFDDYDTWFPLLDSLGVDSAFREKLNKLAIKNEVISEGLTTGYIQQAFQLLPYLPNIILKLGSKGILYFSISTSINDYSSIPTTSEYRPEFTITSSGREYFDDNGGNKKMGIAIQYFPIPNENKDIQIKNVTGAGDSLLGYLTATLLRVSENSKDNTWLSSEINSIEEEWFKWESLYKSQVASGLSLQSNEAISSKIAKIK